MSAGGPGLGGGLMTYDLSRRSLVVLGASALTNSAETWERLGTGTWRLRTSFSPPPGSGSSLFVYDSRRGRCVLLVGGRMLVYEPVTPATYATHGSGCPGSLGLPTLRTTAPWALAWLGDTLSVTVDNLPTSSAVLGIGFDDQSFGGRALPLHLWPGLPFRCFLRIAPAATFLLSGSNNRATHSLPIPNQSSLLGLTYYQQALAFDPVAIGGAVMSYSAVGTVGGR